MSIEEHFDISFVAAQALREKQIQQNYRPIIAVHKWFARRPGTLFRALILSEFGNRSVKDQFFQRNDFAGKRVADPFMGGGTPLLEDRTSQQGPRYEVVACIAGRGFKQRREDMKKLLVATAGRVFTLQTLPQLVEHTGIRAFETRKPKRK